MGGCHRAANALHARACSRPRTVFKVPRVLPAAQLYLLRTTHVRLILGEQTYDDVCVAFHDLVIIIRAQWPLPFIHRRNWTLRCPACFDLGCLKLRGAYRARWWTKNILRHDCAVHTLQKGCSRFTKSALHRTYNGCMCACTFGCNSFCDARLSPRGVGRWLLFYYCVVFVSILPD